MSGRSWPRPPPSNRLRQRWPSLLGRRIVSGTELGFADHHRAVDDLWANSGFPSRSAAFLETQWCDLWPIFLAGHADKLHLRFDKIGDLANSQRVPLHGNDDHWRKDNVPGGGLLAEPAIFSIDPRRPPPGTMAQTSQCPLSGCVRQAAAKHRSQVQRNPLVFLRKPS